MYTMRERIKIPSRMVGFVDTDRESAIVVIL